MTIRLPRGTESWRMPPAEFLEISMELEAPTYAVLNGTIDNMFPRGQANRHINPNGEHPFFPVLLKLWHNLTPNNEKQTRLNVNVRPTLAGIDIFSDAFFNPQVNFFSFIFCPNLSNQSNLNEISHFELTTGARDEGDGRSFDEHRGWEQALTLNGRHVVKCYISRDNTQFVILSNKADWETIYRFWGIATKMFLANCEVECQPLVALMAALGNLKDVDFERQFAQIITWPMFANRQYERLVKSLRVKEVRRTEECEAKIDHLISQIDTMYSKLTQYKTDLDTTNRLLFSYRHNNQAAQETDTIINYLKNAPYIDKVLTSDLDALEIITVAPLKYWDKTPIKIAIDNSYTDSDVGIALQNIFMDEKYEIFCHAKFSIDLGEPSVSLTGNSGEYNNAIPHPHLVSYSCIGDNYDYIYDAAVRSDYIGLFEQVLSASYNINFYDGPVANKLEDAFEFESTYYDVPCIRRVSDQARISIREMFLEIKLERSQNETNETDPGAESVPFDTSGEDNNGDGNLRGNEGETAEVTATGY